MASKKKGKGKIVDERDDRDETTDSKGKSRTGRKSVSSPKDLEGKRDFVYSTGKPSNDPRWYLNNPTLSRDVGSIWFSRPTGNDLPSTANGSIRARAGFDFSTQEPGIMVMETMLNWGGNGLHADYEYVDSAINVSAAKLYQYVVHANSRNTSYDAKSLMMSIMAVDAIYQVITEAIRAYRLLNMYSFENAYIANLLRALGWNAEVCKEEVAQFRYYINLAISRVNKFFIPMLFDIVRAHQAAYENIYLDRPTTKGQLIVTKSSGVWDYRAEEGELVYTTELDVTAATGTMQKALWGQELRTPRMFNSVVSKMLINVETAQYMGVMQGDMLKAFGLGAMMQYNYIGIDEAIYPIYDEEVLLKWHNAEIPSVQALRDALHYPSSASTTPGKIELCKYRDTATVDGGIYCIHTHFGDKGYNNDSPYPTHFIDLPADLANTADNTLLMTLYKKFQQIPTTDKWKRGEEESEETLYVSELNPEEILAGYIYTSPSFVPITMYSGLNIAPTDPRVKRLLSWYNGNAPATATPPGAISPNSPWAPFALVAAAARSRFRKAPLMYLPWFVPSQGLADRKSVV